METVEDKLEKVASFFSPYLPFANAHLADFITKKHWEKFVSPELGQELLDISFSGRERLLQDVKERIASQLPSKSVKCLNQTDIKRNKAREDVLPDLQQTSHPETPSIELQEVKLLGSLEKFINITLQHSLSYLGVLEDASFTETCKIDNFIPFGMSEKKRHEVESMARVCNQLAKVHGISKFVDIGSGKGYLSETLSMEYKMSGIGIDSSDVNTDGAQDRNRKLEKYWTGMKRNVTNKESGIKLTKKEKKELRISKWASPESDQKSQVEYKDPRVSVTADPSSNMSQSSHGNIPSNTGKDGNPYSFVPMTLFVTETTDLESLISSNFSSSSDGLAHNRTNPAGPEFTAENFIKSNPLTLLDAKENAEYGQMSEFEKCLFENCIMLTGLHTCGNLSPTILKLFVHNDFAKLLCLVGCCYHLIDEEYFTCPFAGQKEGSTNTGFPMSEYLRKCKYSLGRNARMLASQSIERFTESTREIIEASDRSKFWRCLLQVILRDLSNGEVSKEWQVGRIAAKCSTFKQYVRKALTKLGFQQEQISDQQIEEYENQYSAEKDRLVAFCFIRTLLAPVIESLIVLDRLCYLLKQPNVQTVHLVQMFDRAVSPRCYAIVATKSHT